MASPPPSLKRSGWLGTAWQEEHPPALNIINPLTGLGAAGGAVAGMTGEPGAVSHQNAAKAMTPASTALGKIRRGIHRSVTVRLKLSASMAVIRALGCLKI